jgi:hypothetical protein
MNIKEVVVEEEIADGDEIKIIWGNHQISLQTMTYFSYQFSKNFLPYLD